MHDLSLFSKAKKFVCRLARIFSENDSEDTHIPCLKLVQPVCHGDAEDGPSRCLFWSLSQPFSGSASEGCGVCLCYAASSIRVTATEQQFQTSWSPQEDLTAGPGKPRTKQRLKHVNRNTALKQHDAEKYLTKLVFIKPLLSCLFQLFPLPLQCISVPSAPAALPWKADAFVGEARDWDLGDWVLLLSWTNTASRLPF